MVLGQRRVGHAALRLDVVAAQLCLSLITTGSSCSPRHCQPLHLPSHPQRLQQVRTRTVDPSPSGALAIYRNIFISFFWAMKNGKYYRPQGLKIKESNLTKNGHFPFVSLIFPTHQREDNFHPKISLRCIVGSFCVPPRGI